MEKLANMPNIGWIVILIFGILIFILFLRRGGKLSVMGQTIALNESDEKQEVDPIGLMYLMKNSCEHIELLRRERMDDILPDISYLISELSMLACCIYRAEATLKKRVNKNGFETLTAPDADRYIKNLSTELYKQLLQETSRAKHCTLNKDLEIKKEKIDRIAREFTMRSIRAYYSEVAQKAAMYDSYKPLFSKMGDTIRVNFCERKKKKKLEQKRNLQEILNQNRGGRNE